MSVRPDFFIVGAAKCGTTSLYRYLCQHPQVWMPDLKEPHFFGEYRPPGPVFSNIEEYLALFDEADSSVVVGEASTAYLYSPSAAREIAEFNPRAKIIMVLRNPMDRAYSAYWHHVRDGNEDLGFRGALKAEGERVQEGWRYGFHYVQGGMYADQVLRYQQLFPPAQVHVILFEDLKLDAATVMAGLFDFLDVDCDWEVKTGQVHNRSGPPRFRFVSKFLRSRSPIKRALLAPVPVKLKKRWKEKVRDMNISVPPSMPLSERADLIDIFSSDVQRLAKYINRDLSAWME